LGENTLYGNEWSVVVTTVLVVGENELFVFGRDGQAEGEPFTQETGQRWRLGVDGESVQVFDLIGGTEPLLLHRVRESYEEIDDALNAKYQELMSMSKGSDRDRLRIAERSWLKFRDAECAYQGAAWRGNSGRLDVVNLCMANLTRHRGVEIGRYLECVSADYECVSDH
jgi:hypothetical protein